MKEGKLFFRVDDRDNVAVALESVACGSNYSLGGVSYRTTQAIPYGHKIALSPIARGEAIIRYGNPIGHATENIPAGAWVHCHNMRTNLEGVIDYTYTPESRTAIPAPNCRRTFQGYERQNGEVGTRNEIWIIPTVSCVNQVVEQIAREASVRYDGMCDGIYAYPHNAGCSQMGENHLRTQRILANIIRHPNAGGVLLVSLGCENNGLPSFLPMLGEYDHRRIRTMVAQNIPGDEVKEGIRLVGEIADEVSRDRRGTVSVDKLRIGFKCGGSDSLSGLTANPLCGKIADRITGLGGTAILSEVPEMFGAEQLLMNRARDEETYRKIVTLINDFKYYYLEQGCPIFDNPSPGNKEGGITTLEEKSLGCIQKGGSSVIVDTLDYGQWCREKGLNLLKGPGNDSVSITNLFAAGAQLLLFTTGRGNPLGSAVPTVKLASNTILAQRKENWIDFNAGVLIETDSFDCVTDDLWDLLLDVASGRQTKNEIHGHRSIMIMKDGPLL